MPKKARKRPLLRGQAASNRRRLRRKRLFVVGGVGALVFLFLLAILIDSTAYHGKIHAGVTVSGVKLGGLTPEEAKRVLDQRAEEVGQSQVTLKSGDKTWTVTPQDVEATMDTAATVDEALATSRKSNFLVDRFRGFIMYFRAKTIPLQGTVDDTKMELVIAEVAQSVDVPPINAGLLFDGPKIRIVKGQKGRVVDRQALAAQLKAVLLSVHSTEIQVPMAVKEPTVVADDFDEALQKAILMTSGPLNLTSGSDSWALDTEDIVAYMDFRARSEGDRSILVPYLSGDKMAPFLDEVAAAVKTLPVSASFKGDGTKAWVVPGIPGKELDAEKTVEALNKAVLDGKKRSTKAVLTLKNPRLTTEEAKAMGIKDVLGDYQTEWEGTPDRQTNVRVTTRYASDVLLAPGEVYDFDEQIGPRTVERGYKPAPGIVRAGELEDVLGGGICQVSTTLFNAAFRAGLDIVERKNHSIYIDHYPKGRDATVSANGPNLRFRNDTKHHILIRGVSNGIITKFVIYGTDDGRTVKSETGEFYDVVQRTVESTPNKSLAKGATNVVDKGQDGKKIKVTRVVKSADGKVIHKDVFVSVWPMFPREIEVGTGPTTTTATKPTTGTTVKTTTTPTTDKTTAH